MAKILIVDDDVEIQELLTFTLQNEGYEVVVVDNGNLVFDRARQEKPDLIVLDVMLPGITGFEALQKLRNDDETFLIPVIMLTSMAQTKDRITGIKLGADEYLAKPFEPFEIVARIEGLLRRVNADLNAGMLKSDASFENDIKKLLRQAKPFYIYSASINNLKTFTIRFGYNCADKFISDLHDIIQKTLTEFCDNDSSTYKMLGENVAFICKPQSPELIANKIRESFEAISKNYADIDRLRNQKTPLLSLSILCLLVNPDEYKHYLEVVEKIKTNSLKI